MGIGAHHVTVIGWTLMVVVGRQCHKQKGGGYYHGSRVHGQQVTGITDYHKHCDTGRHQLQSSLGSS